MIKALKDTDTRRLWEGVRVRRFQSFRRQALRRLDVLNAAIRIDDLRLNPGNRLEKLNGKRKGQYGIRINRQWRV